MIDLDSHGLLPCPARCERASESACAFCVCLKAVDGARALSMMDNGFLSLSLSLFLLLFVFFCALLCLFLFFFALFLVSLFFCFYFLFCFFYWSFFFSNI